VLFPKKAFLSFFSKKKMLKKINFFLFHFLPYIKNKLQNKFGKQKKKIEIYQEFFFFVFQFNKKKNT
jgi:hypothetical protein